ncbi:MAG: hypothetical protein IKM18_04375 [Clostridia bacterium]|nr:hypothetical protein [Clostridia bacterium]
MKKLIIFILTVSLLVPTFYGCSADKPQTAPEGPLFDVLIFNGKEAKAKTDISKALGEEIIHIMSGYEWEEKLPECIANVEFKADGKTIWYSADNGYFCDISNECHITVDDDARKRANEIFGVSESKKTDTGKEKVIYFYQYSWDGWGIEVKSISACDEAYKLITALSSAKKTGKTEPMIAEDFCNSFLDLPNRGISLPVERGTIWIEAEEKRYRIDGDFTQLCLVETYFGKGEALVLTDELKNMIIDMRNYWPNDVYYGEYDKSSNEITLRHLYSADSSVDIKIKEIYVRFMYRYNKNKITLELTSDIYQIAEVDVLGYKSSDNLLDGDRRNVPLRAGTNVADFSFGSSFDYYFWLSIKSGNTIITLKIQA